MPGPNLRPQVFESKIRNLQFAIVNQSAVAVAAFAWIGQLELINAHAYTTPIMAKPVARLIFWAAAPTMSPSATCSPVPKK